MYNKKYLFTFTFFLLILFSFKILQGFHLKRDQLIITKAILNQITLSLKTIPFLPFSNLSGKIRNLGRACAKKQKRKGKILPLIT